MHFVSLSIDIAIVFSTILLSAATVTTHESTGLTRTTTNRKVKAKYEYAYYVSVFQSFVYWKGTLGAFRLPAEPHAVTRGLFVYCVPMERNIILLFYKLCKKKQRLIQVYVCNT